MSTVVRLVCSRCGCRAGGEDEFCPGCSARMARTGRPEWSTGMYERFFQLKEATDRVASGEWPPSEFVEFLDSMSATLERIEASIRGLEVPVEHVEAVQEELATGMSGIALYREGIAEMRRYAEDEDPSHLEAGLLCVVAGNERLIQALRLTRKRGEV